MMSAEASSKASNNGSSNRTKRPTSSGAPVTKSGRRSHVTDAPQMGSMSSPLAPTQPGLTPQKVRRRASSQLSPRDIESPPYDWLSCVGEFQGTESDVDTSSKEPGRRLRSASSASSCAFELSSLRQGHTQPQENSAATEREQKTASRPVLEKSQTSPQMHAEAERLQQRPDLPDRGASDPVTPNPKSNSHIDRDLRKLIRKGPSTKNKERETGDIYLFQVRSTTADVELFKLGRTQADADTRRTKIKRVCRPAGIQENEFAVSESLPFHGYAERLAHTELVNFRYSWGCTCGSKHQEYFDVSEDFAVEVFKRWRDFCDQKPWTSDGKILPLWEQRLNNKPLIRGGDRKSDHQELARHWSEFTSPTDMELVASDAILAWKDVFPERWQIVAIAELLTIICISPVSFWVTTWALVIGSLLLIDLVVTKDMHIFKLIEGLIMGGLQALKLGGNSDKEGRNGLNLNSSSEGHRMQTLTPSERPTPRGLDNLTFSAMQNGRYDDPGIMADSSPGAYPNESPGATDCESDMEDVGCSSPCAEKASRRRTPDIRVDLASANPENTVDEDSDLALVE